LAFEHEVTCSNISQSNNWRNEWYHQNIDWEECKSNTSNKFVEGNTVLHLDDVESLVSIKVSPYLLIFVDEHSGKERHKQNFEQVHENSNVCLTHGHLESSEILVTIESIEQIQNDLKEGGTLELKLSTQESSDEYENENDKTEG
jgi:hypothetical protein